MRVELKQTIALLKELANKLNKLYLVGFTDYAITIHIKKITT